MGGLHALLATLDIFRPRNFTATDDSVRLAMTSTTVRFSRRRANLWDAWLGFNISHGIGMLLFGAIAVWLGVSRNVLLTPVILALLTIIALLYFVLSVRFWFYAPALGSGIATACFAAAWASS